MKGSRFTLVSAALSMIHFCFLLEAKRPEKLLLTPSCFLQMFFFSPHPLPHLRSAFPRPSSVRHHLPRRSPNPEAPWARSREEYSRHHQLFSTRCGARTAGGGGGGAG